MTSQSPRIYIYKITFEEVLCYYYGVHKEKKFDDYYMGSPVTHKWCWNFYTPKKQILQFFEFNDAGWLEAQEIEKRIIRPFLNDRWCLNENCGNIFSLTSCSKAGKMGGAKTYELGVGIHSLSTEEIKEIGRKAGYKTYELGVGIHAQTKEERQKNGKLGCKKSHKIQKELGVGFWGLTLEQRQENAKKGDIKRKENKSGIYGLTNEEKSESGKKSAQQLHSQKWMCTETGHITNAGALTRYQKHRKIDTSKRKRVS